MMLRGADVSAYQDSTVPAGEFVIIKATEGLNYVSSKWRAQLADARKKGMLVGFYHFGHPGHDPVAEAEFFCSTIRSSLTDADLVVLDHEVSDGTSAAHCASWAKQWLQHVELRLGRRPVVYTYLAFAREGRCAGLGGYPLWIAHYTTAGKPSVPAPWSRWVLHQWTDKPTDQNVLNGGREAWPAGSAPTPREEDDMLAGKVEATGQTIIPFPTGKFSAVGFSCDNGFVGAPAAKLRVAIHSTSGQWQIEHVTVGRAKPTDLAKKTVVKFTDAKSVDYVAVTREDDSTLAIGFDAS